MADENTYVQGSVYREQNTGKIRVKDVTKIDYVTEDSPPTEEQAAINAILDLLTAAGINPDD